MSQEIFKGVVKLTQTQYEELKQNGTITVGQQTVAYSPTDTVYVTPVTQQDIIRISNEDFLDYLTDGGLPQGQVALCDRVIAGSNGYLLGHLYKFNIVYGETNQYSWTDITPAGLPTTTATINGNADTYTIANSGTYIFLGDVGTLTITATEAVTITILGNLGTVTLPETSATVLIHAVGYNGTFDTRPNSLKNGSVLGPYNIGRIDLV